MTMKIHKLYVEVDKSRISMYSHKSQFQNVGEIIYDIVRTQIND
jgi:hypothetical protein